LKRKRHKHHKKHPRDDHGPDGKGPGGGVSPGEEVERRPRPLIAEDSRHLEIALVLIALVAVLVRAIYLAADPPLDLSWSQALFTDGARAIDGARNRIMYGEWMADRVSPVLLFYPISNVLAYIIYRVGGIGLAQANLTGVLPALGTLALVWYFMRKSAGKVAALVALAVFAVPYAYVIYSRTPLLESLQIFLLVAAFVALLRRKAPGFVAAGVLVGAAAFMVKLHALHFAAVVLVYLFFAARTRDDADLKPYRLGALFLLGLGVAFAVWLAGVYSVDPAAVSKYFRSNILNTQTAEYTGASAAAVVGTRIRQFFHVGSGIDMFFRRVPVMAILAALGLMPVISGFARGNRSLRDWEMLSAVWFLVFVTALSFLSYRPLRYFIPLIPSMGFLVTSLVVRLINGDPLLHQNKPRWFVPVFFLYLVWVLIHVQHDVIFKILQPNLGGTLTAAQQSLAQYDLSIAKQLLLTGGVAAGILLLAGRNLRRASLRFRRGTRKNLAVLAIAALVVLNLVKFAGYCASRTYSIVNMAESLERVTSPGAFIVGDCATTLSLETDFRTLPSYGEIIRRDDRKHFEQYPITHFLIRFPTLYEYLEANYPDFRAGYAPVDRYGLCGREATVIRYEAWPGYPDSYAPSEFERAMSLLSKGDIASAKPLFESFLGEHPDSYEAMFGLAICISVSGEIEAARDMLHRGIEIAPEGALSYHVYKDILEALLTEGSAGH
jgi:4-amino-4-deoxy-L-arabinose transferase-like glycosyltransferase